MKLKLVIISLFFMNIIIAFAQIDNIVEYKYGTIINDGYSFFQFKVYNDSLIIGKAGYHCCRSGEADSWEGTVKGRIKDNQISGTYRFMAEGEYFNYSITVNIFKNHVIFKEAGEEPQKLFLEKTTIYSSNYVLNRINKIVADEQSFLKGKLIFGNYTNPFSEHNYDKKYILKLSEPAHIWGNWSNKVWMVDEILLWDNKKNIKFLKESLNQNVIILCEVDKNGIVYSDLILIDEN